MQAKLFKLLALLVASSQAINLADAPAADMTCSDVDSMGQSDRMMHNSCSGSGGCGGCGGCGRCIKEL